MWEMLELVRVYTKKKGQQPDFSEPIVLTRARGGYTVQAAIEQVGAPTTRRGYASRACVCVCWGLTLAWCAHGGAGIARTPG